MKKKALVVLSGGQDSTTCLYWALNNPNYSDVRTITFDYGQKHSVEIEAAQKIANLAGVENEIINIRDTLKGTSPLVNKDFEVEKYKDADSLPGGLEKTFVPSRNMLFLTIASNRAYIHDCSAIITGVSQEDFGGYPDCRQTFIDSMEKTFLTGLEKPIKIVTPLIDLNKKQTVELAVKLDGCMNALYFSHTCYEGEHPVPCGKCHACLLRQKGFDEAGVIDPIQERAAIWCESC
jgi:7-cyano-7-deazaguanine synthase